MVIYQHLNQRSCEEVTFVRSLQRTATAAQRGLARRPLVVSRREMLAGGIGAGALIALPDLSSTRPGAASPAASASSGARYVLLYGTPESRPFPGGSVAAALSPVTPSRTLPAPKAVAAKLAAAPVSSPDQASVALITVDTVPAGAKVTLTLVDSTSAVVEQQGSLTITDIPDGTNILPTPVFAPGTTTIAVVLAITEPSDRRLVSKKDPHTGVAVPMHAVTWTSHHALAYFDRRSGDFTGPFDLGNAPALALTTAAANHSDLFLWTTAEPQPDHSAKSKPRPAPLPWVSVFPLGSGRARVSVPSPAPWPAGEPVVTLASSDVARLVNGRTVQVSSALTGEVTQVTIDALNVIRAKPSAITMQSRPDGTVFITKPGLGRAVIADPADSFRVKAQVSFPVPAVPLGAPSSKAVLSPSGETLYVLGGVQAGGLSAYDVGTGALTASYSHGTRYSGLYQLPSGTLLAVSAANPRLTFFSPALSPLGTAETTLQISAVF
jgi:hypothetical protein